MRMLVAFLFRQLIGTVLNFVQALAAYNEQIGDVNGKFIGPYADGVSSCLVFWDFVLRPSEVDLVACRYYHL